MRTDESGVAGFLEDLPTLMFVLGGAALLVSSGLWTSTRLGEQDADRKLQELADRAADAIVNRLESISAGDSVPTFGSIEKAALPQFVSEVMDKAHFSLNISALHSNAYWWISFHSGSTGPITNTGFASRMINAQDGSGLILVCEVRLVVWRN